MPAMGVIDDEIAVRDNGIRERITLEFIIGLEAMTGHPDSPAEPAGPPRHREAMGPTSQDGSVHTSQQHNAFLHSLQNISNSSENLNCMESDYVLPVPMAPAATPVQVSTIVMDSHDPSILHQDAACGNDSSVDVKIKFETLRSLNQQTTLDMDTHMSQQQAQNPNVLDHSMMLTSEMLNLMPREQETDKEDIPPVHDDMNESCHDLSNDGVSPSSSGLTNLQGTGSTPKTWSQQDMENALDALRNHNMSLTKASATFGIPSTTLWQRAHRLGIDTPKKEGPSKSWSEGNLHSALQALRTGTISANKASKAYGIPSSTLYKIARREGIRLAAPFNAAPTAWRPGDLERALHSIRSGHSSVQRASTEFGIPTGTLYGRCKREGIELSRSNPTPWSEDAMGEALEAVRIGQMSINQAAIHYNLPYSSLYGRFKRCKYEGDINGPVDISPQHMQDSHTSHHMLQQSALGSQSVHMLDRNTPLDSPQHLYSVYHHPIVLPVSIHNPGETSSVNHSNQDCIPIS